MNKKEYVIPDMECVRFLAEDVITTSNEIELQTPTNSPLNV